MGGGEGGGWCRCFQGEWNSNNTSNEEEKSSYQTQCVSGMGSSIIARCGHVGTCLYSKQADSARMACTMWVPGMEERKDDTSMPPPPPPPAKKIKNGDFYQAVQRYDLDAVPLREASAPEVHYVWMIDPSKNYAGYHPVGSRVQLSTGRPINLSNGNTSSGAEISTDRSIVSRRALEEDEKRDVEKRMAEVDVDLAEKYGMAEGGNVRGSASSAGGKGGQGGGDNGQKRRSIADCDDSEMEEDAF